MPGGRTRRLRTLVAGPCCWVLASCRRRARRSSTWRSKISPIALFFSPFFHWNTTSNSPNAGVSSLWTAELFLDSGGPCRYDLIGVGRVFAFPGFVVKVGIGCCVEAVAPVFPDWVLDEWSGQCCFDYNGLHGCEERSSWHFVRLCNATPQIACRSMAGDD